MKGPEKAHSDEVASEGVWRLPALDAYFDAGLIPEAGHPDAVVQIGYAIFRPGAKNAKEQLSSGSLTCLPGDAPGGLWELRTPRLTVQERTTFSTSQAGKGLQFYDLIAARGLAVSLRGTGFGGAVRVFGDGKEVIRFLNGDDGALTLRVGDLEFARELRSEVVEGFGPGITPEWHWIRSELNLADKAMKALQIPRVAPDGSASLTLPGGPSYGIRGPRISRLGLLDRARRRLRGR